VARIILGKAMKITEKKLRKIVRLALRGAYENICDVITAEELKDEPVVATLEVDYGFTDKAGDTIKCERCGKFISKGENVVHWCTPPHDHPPFQ